MNFPGRLLNADAKIYQEVNAKGSLGQVTQSLVLVASMRCRLDQKSTTRTIAGGSFEQTTGRYTVYLPGVQVQPIEENFWLKITTAIGVIVAQVASVRLPAMLNHHTELEVVKRSPALELPA